MAIGSYHHSTKRKKGEKKHKLDEKGGRIKHDSLSHITSTADEYFAGSLVTVIGNTIGVQELDTEQQRLAEMPDDIPPPRNQVGNKTIRLI
jgi:hypothetical protein